MMARAVKKPASRENDPGTISEEVNNGSNGNGDNTVLRSSATGTTFLIMIQLASRIFTFASNQLILRSLSPIILGIAAQLELFQVTILYFSRESIRMAIQRQPLVSSSSSSSKKDTAAKNKEQGSQETNSQSIASQAVVNVSYLSIFLGLLFTAAFTRFYESLAPNQAQSAPLFNESVKVTALASLLELTIEPFFAVIQQRMWYEKRAAVEMPAAFLKSLVTCSSFFYASRQGIDVGPLPFALGYLTYSLALIVGYYWTLLWVPFARGFSFLPARIETSNEYISGIFSRRLTFLAATVFFQSLVKHLLTQGDSMMLAALSSLEDQGIYSLAANYGGLVARIIFQPLEESSRNLFSALLTSNEKKDSASTRARSAGSDEEEETNTQQIRTAKSHLITLLKAYQLLSILVLPIGPIMVPTLLKILGGRQWTSNKVSDLLSLYCYYIPFLAFNGITEAFVSSAADPSEIRAQTLWMGVFSACYAFAAYIFLEVASLGAYGLVCANLVNMAVRTIWSFGFIRGFLKKKGVGLRFGEIFMMPISYGLLGLATVLSQMVHSLRENILEAIAFSAVYGLLMLYVERRYIMQQVAEIRQIASSRAKPKLE